MITAQEHFEKDVEQFCENITLWKFNYSINISLKYNYLYFETPKAGCTTIKATLQKMELERTGGSCGHPSCVHDRNFSPLLRPSQISRFSEFVRQPGLFKFCFVRNPYTRLLSAYLEKMLTNKRPKRIVLHALGRNPADLDVDVSFDEFIDVVCGQKVRDMNTHWMVQYYLTCQDLIKYDFVGKIENFDQDFDFVLSKLSENYRQYISKEVSHATNAGMHLETYYSSELSKKVQEKYKKDFEYFGYSADFRQAVSLI
jgi:hypothetical protein